LVFRFQFAENLRRVFGVEVGEQHVAVLAGQVVPVFQDLLRVDLLAERLDAGHVPFPQGADEFFEQVFAHLGPHGGLLKVGVGRKKPTFSLAWWAKGGRTPSPVNSACVGAEARLHIA